MLKPIIITNSDGTAPLVKAPVGGGFGGTQSPWVADDPCICCPPPCPPCAGTCTTGWASGKAQVVGGCDTQHPIIHLIDTSTPPPGFCYTGSLFMAGGQTYGTPTADPRVYVAEAFTNCFDVTLTSFAHCCDTTHCGSCQDTTTVTISTKFCCCYGGKCTNGEPTYNFPSSIAVTAIEFTATASGTGCPLWVQPAYAFWRSLLPGTLIANFDPVKGYDTTYVSGVLLTPGCTAGKANVKAWVRVSAEINCEGLYQCGIGCGAGDPPTFTECPATQACSTGGIGLVNLAEFKKCNGTYTDPNLVRSCTTGAFCGSGVRFKGISVTW